MDRFVNKNDVIELLIGLDSLPWEEEVDDIVNSLPATEVREIIHAKWERPVLIKGHWYRRCTKCLYDSAHGAADNKEFMPIFCSNCGAIMDGE